MGSKYWLTQVAGFALAAVIGFGIGLLADSTIIGSVVFGVLVLVVLALQNRVFRSGST